MSEAACPFCTVEVGRIFHAGRLVIGLWDGFPVSQGHALLVPKRHVADWFETTDDERRELTDAVAVARDAILQRHQPDGFNIGINVGEAAGQTVFHLHVHVIPRYHGDVADPRGGVRHVIPSRGYYAGHQHVEDTGALADAAERYDQLQTPAGLAHLIAGGETAPLLAPLRLDMDAAVRIDLAVSFIFASGLDLIEPHLIDALKRGAAVRILTGDYQDVTEPRALRRLLDLNGSVQLRVFEARATGFHPKAYVFTRTGSAGVAYVGSSNVSKTALLNGIEWNYRVDSREDPAGFAEVQSQFDNLFQHPATLALDADWITAYAARRQMPAVRVDLGPEPPAPPPEPTVVQHEALAALTATRADGNAVGLVVMATGLGKTFLSAFDSASFRRVLFVAHREEILEQAIQAYRRVRPDDRFGRYTGGEKVPDADVLFASVQTLSRLPHLRRFAPEAFDYIVVDEFHHACAATYRRLIAYFRPQFLLGLTATPERTDGGDLLSLCGENLVYRCDFMEGIRRELLSPFHYFGVPDEVDYTNIPWRSSRFDEEALTEAVATQSRAQNALEQHRDKAGDRTLAFCCSMRHADFMADFFRDAGLRVAAVHSGANSAPRAASLERLRDGELDVVFAVDMFNEGVDVPAIDTVMMLRPTESAILWLQQFGRGLRRCEGKERLTVIDYIGNHRTFLLKPQTLFQLDSGDGHIARVLDLVARGEAELPPGCEVTYDLKAVDIIRGLLRVRPRDDEALRLYYEDFRERHGVRPQAVGAFHDGYAPRSARTGYGSWLRFVRTMDGLSEQQQAVLRDHGGFLDAIETTPMTRSYKMLVLLAMLNADALPGEITTDVLVHEVDALARRSAKLRQDVGPALDDASELRRLLEENPIAAWAGGKGTGGVAHFAYVDGRFSMSFQVSAEHRAAFQELVREVADWRLAEYLRRIGEEGPEHFVCKVSHAGSRPILFLPDRERRPDLPQGKTEVLIDGEQYEADFVNVALNVVKRPGSDKNELPMILRRWFGADAGLPGTDFRVALAPDGERYTLTPLGRPKESAGPELWRAYAREEIPPLFGLKFNSSIWQTGFVVQRPHMFLLVTLDKGSLEEQFRYKDHFLGPDEFQWQSQNRTAQASRTGQSIKNHAVEGITIHLFVRRQSKTDGRAAPFTYCGEVAFVGWEGDQPITVRWKLKAALPERLHAMLEPRPPS